MQGFLLVGAAMVVCGVIGLSMARRGLLPMLNKSDMAASLYALALACLLMGGIGLVGVQFL
jgi:hypothetical protein